MGINDRVITVFGDSIAYGMGGTEKCGWVNRLRLALENPEYQVVVHNLSIPGQTTIDLIARFESELRVRCDSSKTNVVAFAVGINDSSTFGSIQRVPYNLFTMNLKKLIHLAQKYTDKITFIGLTPVDETRAEEVKSRERIRYSNDKIRQYDNGIRAVCEETGNHYIPLFDTLLSADLHDGLHPNSLGHHKICDRIVNARKYTR
ncbi:MAG: GDSL-type esterase/lipase family protein [Christensenellaceae bacterium]|jgi:lysophospholipase L1-like esterase|nr:GDSL-type esterase/lipase family protein [Christensenellaceae bacterium]